MFSITNTNLKAIGLSLLLGTTITNSAAIPSVEAYKAKRLLSRQAGNDFRVVIYNNAQCTGSAITFDGDGPQCLRALGSGGGGAQLISLDADGIIIFWDEVECEGEITRDFTAADPTGPRCINLDGNPLSVEYDEI